MTDDPHQALRDLASLGRLMRAQQILFDKTKDRHALAESRVLEALFDKACQAALAPAQDQPI